MFVLPRARLTPPGDACLIMAIPMHPLFTTANFASPSYRAAPSTCHLPSLKDDEESKRKGARSLAAYMQLSDAVFTPYAESLYPASGGEGQARTQ